MPDQTFYQKQKSIHLINKQYLDIYCCAGYLGEAIMHWILFLFLRSLQQVQEEVHKDYSMQNFAELLRSSALLIMQYPCVFPKCN